MAKEICISSTPHETRLAILEDDQLAEIYYERENEYTLAGSIYNGRVTRVLPGMQSAFVDIGLERDAFLYVTDFLELEDQEESDELEKAAATGATSLLARSATATEANAAVAANSASNDLSKVAESPLRWSLRPLSRALIRLRQQRDRKSPARSVGADAADGAEDAGLAIWPLLLLGSQRSSSTRG